VRGTKVIADNSTEYDDGKCSDMKNGRKVQIKGLKQPDGSVLAREIEFEDDDDD
jgi:hypothetical protein